MSWGPFLNFVTNGNTFGFCVPILPSCLSHMLIDLPGSRYLAPHIRPNTLSLILICKVGSLEAAQEVTTTISQLPTVKNCAIRLDGGARYRPCPNPEYTELCRRTVFKATSDSNKSEKPFRQVAMLHVVKLGYKSILSCSA